MIDVRGIGEIIATYEKHGWILRRVLVSEALKTALGNSSAGALADVPVRDSVIDAAWFSRPPKPGGVAWEIRYLGDVPFALLENLDEDDADFDSAMRAVELRLGETISAKKSA